MWTSDRQSSTLGTDVLARFANFKLAGDRAVRDVAETIVSVSAASTSAVSNAAARGAALHARGGAGRRGRRRRRYTSRRQSNRRVGGLTDAELEAELAARRAQRARERERYARHMRSDKLQVLEMELNSLRTKIGGGTPANPRWESLGADGRARAPSLNASVRREPPATPAPVVGAPPPPPPMGGLRDPNEEEEIDPERQKREKAERQRRREQKRKEREANKKPMTLADIIRSAGKNPIARLKPKGSTATDDVNEVKVEEKNEMENVTLTKAVKKTVEVKVEESELSIALKKKGEKEEDKKTEEGKTEPSSEEEAQNDEGKEKDVVEKGKEENTSEGKNPEVDAHASPDGEKKAANGDTPAKQGAVYPAKDDALTKSETPKTGETETKAGDAEAKPRVVTPEAEIEPAVEQEGKPAQANGTAVKDANGAVSKPQLEEVISKLAVKKALKDSKPSDRNIDQSPDTTKTIAADADGENKNEGKPNLDALLMNLNRVTKKKKSV